VFTMYLGMKETLVDYRKEFSGRGELEMPEKN
jgi:hypothetical protein